VFIMKWHERVNSLAHEFKDTAIAVAVIGLMVGVFLVVREVIPLLRETTGVLKQIRVTAESTAQTTEATNKLLNTTERVMGQLPDKVIGAIHEEGQKTRDLVATQADKIRKETVEPELVRYRWMLNGNLSKVVGIRDDLQPSFQNVNAITSRLRETSDILLDCKGHGDCLPSQSLALVGSARFTLGQVAKATPEFIALYRDFVSQGQKTNVQLTGIATDVHTFTTKMVAPKPLWQKVGAVAILFGTSALKGGVF
jgi:hypothetical protein